MLGLDTNVLVRYLVQDDLSQYKRARRLIHREAGKGRPCWSVCWFCSKSKGLRSRYSLAKAEVLAAFSALLDADGAHAGVAERSRFRSG